MSRRLRSASTSTPARGSRTNATNGVAHLLEHMVFKGTATRSARAIAEEIEDVGGSLNAYTARDMTVFHARLLAERHRARAWT